MKALRFYELVRLSYGAWRHHQPPPSKALCSARWRVHSRLLPSICSCFWASVLLGKLGKWKHNCAHIFGGVGGIKRSYQWWLCAPRTSGTDHWKLPRLNTAAAAAGSVNSSWLRQFNSISGAPGNGPRWFVFVLFTYFIWKSCIDVVPVLQLTLVHLSYLRVSWLKKNKRKWGNNFSTSHEKHVIPIHAITQRYRLQWDQSPEGEEEALYSPTFCFYTLFVSIHENTKNPRTCSHRGKLWGFAQGHLSRALSVSRCEPSSFIPPLILSILFSRTIYVQTPSVWPRWLSLQHI